MTVRHLLGGATLAAAATLFAASSASAQYTISVTNPANGSSVPIFSGSNLVSTATANSSNVTLGTSILTPFFNYNQNPPGNTSFTNVSQTLTVTASKSGFGSNTNGAQSLSIQISGNTTSTTVGPVTTNNVNITPGSLSFSSGTLFFTFSDGSTLTLSGFGATNATNSDGLFGYTTASQTTLNVAPEPGSFALAATGLVGALGMVKVRRRRAA